VSGKTIVILGGGVGGLATANELRRLLARNYRVVLVGKSPVHAFAPSFLWLMTGDRTAAQISRPLRTLVRRGVKISDMTDLAHWTKESDSVATF